jgi:uncharacterized repeat protein (TIGR03987 family)
MLPLAVITITLALVFYSIGVWSEKIGKILKPWHAVMFWIGFLFDTVGTSVMGTLSDDPFTLNFHGIVGLIAILLMLIHAIWATVVLVKKSQKMLASFHKFSIVVWFIWLVPYLSGMILGMSR